MIKNINGTDFKYEDDKMYRLHKQSKIWQCCNDIKANKGYIRIKINNKLYLLHRIIYKYFNEDWDITYSHSNQIDHIDINPSNNRIENLRVATCSQNTRNQKKLNNCSSKFKGVSWHKGSSKWEAKISIDGKSKHLGYFTNEEEAAEAYKKINNEIMKF